MNRLNPHILVLLELRQNVTGVSGHRARRERRALDWALCLADKVERVELALAEAGRLGRK